MGPAYPSKLTAIHVFRIRRLQSEVIFGLYASGRRETPTLDWFNDRQRSIDEWNSTRPRGFGFCSNEWLELCYHQTVTLLHRPCPGNPQPTRESLVRALQGSNATMRLYKEIYRKGLSSFGTSFSSDSRLTFRLVVDVSSFHIRRDLPQLALAGLSQRMEIGPVLCRRTTGLASLHKRNGGSRL